MKLIPSAEKGRYLTVRTLEEVEAAEQAGQTFVLAICPKCGDGTTSIIHNAKNLVILGCLFCSEAWTPVIGVEVSIVKKGENEAQGRDPH